MPILLPPELEAFAHRQINCGKYGSIEEMLVAGVRFLAEREQLESAIEFGEIDAAGEFQARSGDEMMAQSLAALQNYRETGESFAHADVQRWADGLGR
jgi:putative addiction module CopG family antidote